MSAAVTFIYTTLGICRESGDIFLVECPDRSRPTLERLIIENVADNTTIYTDGWSSYRRLGSCGHGYKVYNVTIYYLKLYYVLIFDNLVGLGQP